MTSEDIARTIQLVLAPVVMVSACAIVLGGLMGHYQAVNDRLRAMARERFDLVRGSPDALARERLAEIDHQAPDLLRRHRLVHDALLAIYSAVGLFVATMLAIAIATVSGSLVIATLVLALFLLGTLMLLAGVVLSAIEIGISHRALAYEIERVLALKP